GILQSERVDGRSDENPTFVKAGERIGNEDFRKDRFLNALILRVADDADDRKRWILDRVGNFAEILQGDLATDGVLLPEEFSHQGLVHNGNVAMIGYLLLRQ